MNTNVLAWTPGLMELLVIFFVFIVPVILIILFAVFILRSNKKRRIVQMELDKLADELEQIKKQAEADKKD